MATNGCGNSDPRTLDITTVDAVPGAPEAIEGLTEICGGTDHIYNTNAITNVSYHWILPSGWKGSSSSETITISPENSNGTISVFTQNACGKSPEQTLAIVVKDKPSKPETISGKTTLCAGYETEYSIDEVNGANSYTWTLPSEWNGTSASNVISVIPDKHSGKLLVNATNECGSSEAETLYISVIDVPATPSTITGPNEVCIGAENSFSIAQVPFAETYLWTLPENWEGTSTNETIVVKASENSGTIEVVAKNSCGVSAQQTYTVSVKTIPVPLTIQNGILYTSQAEEYAWFDCDNEDKVLSTESTFTPATSGNYAVTLKSEEGCINTSSCVYVSVMSLPQPFDKMSFSVYPNPAGENVIIDINNLNADKVNVSILDYQGKEYYSKDFHSAANSLHSIPLNDLNNGAYLIKAIYNDNVSIEKITVIK